MPLETALTYLPLPKQRPFPCPQMPTAPEIWYVRYPRRTPHPRRPRVRLGAAERAAASGSSSDLLAGLRTSQSQPQRGHSSRHPLPYHHHRRAEISEIRSPGVMFSMQGCCPGVPVGPPDMLDAYPYARMVRFNSVVKLILVPTRSDLDGLSTDLWWREEDFEQFR